MTPRLERGASLSDEVVAELAPHLPPLACCRAALVEGMQLAAGGGGAAPAALLETTRSAAARAALQALHARGVRARVVRCRAPRRPRFAVVVDDGGVSRAAASTRNCCARALLRGAFLASGAVSGPDRPPHLELVTPSVRSAQRLAAAFAQLGVPVSVTSRRGRWVVAARTVESVGTALSSIGAQHGRLRFEEGRVVREVRAGVNRRINSETANLRRTVSAGLRQVDAIARLRDDPGTWERLPPALHAAATLRVRHPEQTLDGLAALAGCSRSAMAGRLRRLLEVAAT